MPATLLALLQHARFRSKARLLPRSLLIALCLIASFPSAWGQTQLAAVQGQVTAEESGKPVPSVTVVINGPALQEFQTEVTDASGRYIITQLPPGDDYQVSFYFGADEKPMVVRPGIRLSLGKTVTVNASLRLSSGKKEVKVIKETAPNVDVASATTGVELNQEVLRNTPVRGRTFESVLFLAPGASDVAPRRFSTTGGTALPGNEVGVSVSGSTGAENNFIVDGISTTDPSFGLIGTELSQYFIKEVNVLTGGYQAEYGRSTGGIITVATKSGGNEFHGSVFGSIQPYQLTPNAVARLGESIFTRTKINTLFDFGFDLGGYLLKDHIWFYIGFAPTFTNNIVERRFRALVPDGMGGAMRDPDYECPGYLRSTQFCIGASRAALQTKDIDNSGSDIMRQKRLYNYMAKFQFNINPDHNITLGYIGSPVSYDDVADTGYFNIESQRYTRVDQIHDVSARYTGKLLSRKLQIDIIYGYHYQNQEENPLHNGTTADQRIGWNGSYSLADFEDVRGCARMGSFNPCPVTTYVDGIGFYRERLALQRHMLLPSLTAYLHFTQRWNPLRGIHAVKLGFDFEQLYSDFQNSYTGSDYNPNDPTSGHRAYFVQPGDGAPQIQGQFAQLNIANCPRPLDGDPTVCLLDRYHGITQTRNFSVYLRDSWQVDWAPGLVLNLGVRWEGQEVFGQDLKNADPLNPKLGEKAIALYDNWAPRIGLAYDFTQLTSRPGRSKIYFNYGRFYQAIPMNINNRQFTGQGNYISSFSSCNPTPGGPITPRSPDCAYPPGFTLGGSYSTVAPGLKGQYINEFNLGFNYDVGFDIVLGISYLHRDLGNIIEDISPDGGRHYTLANPGVQPDPSLGKELSNEVTRLNQAQMADPQNEQIKADLATAQGRLDAYKLQQQIGTVYPRAIRNYDALVLTMQKRLSNRFSIISSYTFSRTIGNYPGAFSSSNGQLDPNASSQFDLQDLLANRNGPLANDRPHNFKATGFYQQPLFGEKARMTVGLTFTAISGRPIEVLGAHPYYGIHEVFILPRGSGGRTPPVTQFDLHIGYEHKLTRLLTLNLFADVINLFNQRTPTSVDDDYTYDSVSPIADGKAEDLRRLRTGNGTPPTVNSNYGQPTDYQAPLTFRFGGRLSF